MTSILVFLGCLFIVWFVMGIIFAVSDFKESGKESGWEKYQRLQEEEKQRGNLGIHTYKKRELEERMLEEGPLPDMPDIRCKKCGKKVRMECLSRTVDGFERFTVRCGCKGEIL